MHVGMVAGLMLGLAFGGAGIAHASPWTLPEGDLVLVGGFEYQTANREWFDRDSDLGLRRFPLNGHYTATDFSLDVRYGITDDFEVSLGVPFRVVSYEADPIIVAAPPPGADPAVFYRNNILDFSQTVVGLGDFRLSGRYQILDAPIVMAAELGVKAPSGYDQPEGTFGGEVTTIAGFEASAAELVTPQNVSDDVTLGDGQADIHAGLLVGYAFRFGMFMRLDASYRLRLGGAGDQVTGSFRIGQLLFGRVLPYAGVDVAYSVTSGDSIGVSVAARDPELPAPQYTDTDLFLREVPLERSALDLAVGLIVRVTQTVEVNFGYRRTLWGENTALIDAFSASVALRTNLLSGDEPEPPPEPEPEYEEAEYEEYDETEAGEPDVAPDEALDDGEDPLFEDEAVEEPSDEGGATP